MNSLGTVGGIIPQDTGQGSFNVFNPIRGILYFSNRSASWHGTVISEKLGGGIIFKNAGRENNFEVEKVGHKNSEILNHVDSDHIDMNSNQSNSNHTVTNHSDSNHSD